MGEDSGKTDASILSRKYPRNTRLAAKYKISTPKNTLIRMLFCQKGERVFAFQE